MNVYGELKKAQLENISSASPTPATQGRMYLDVTAPAAPVPKVYLNTSWVPIATSLFTVAAKTTTYAATATDDVITVSGASGSWTLTLPDPTANTGKLYRIIRTDSTIANTVTIAPNLQGASRKLCTQYESVTVVSDGTVYQVLEHKSETQWNNSLTFTPNNFGTITNADYRWRRMGDILHARGYFISGTLVSAQASISYPSGIVFDSSKLPSFNHTRLGMTIIFNTGSAAVYGTAAGMTNYYDGSTTDKFFISDKNGSDNKTFLTRNPGDFGSSSYGWQFEIMIPVTNWW